MEDWEIDPVEDLPEVPSLPQRGEVWTLKFIFHWGGQGLGAEHFVCHDVEGGTFGKVPVPDVRHLVVESKCSEEFLVESEHFHTFPEHFHKCESAP